MLVVLLGWPENINQVFYTELILKETGHDLVFLY